MAKKQVASNTESPADAELTFEQAYGELEEIVAQLEQGDLPLEKALELHARGQKLAEYCARQLDEAELKVRTLQG
jgi:exodeoxyribonuclease VII small subunit